MAKCRALAKPSLAALAALSLVGCSSQGTNVTPADGGGGTPAGVDAQAGGGSESNGGAPGAGGASGAAGSSASGGQLANGDGGPGYTDVFDPPGAPPIIGAPGCGLETAAFCDTFDGPAVVQGRGGELDRNFWSASRMMGQLSTTRAFGIGMAVIPDCRPSVSNHVWPNDDTLICDPNADVASDHLLVAVAAQNYGQHGYRIRQPFDFAGRTGKVVFDATVEPLSPLHGWISFAITEDPTPMPGYAIRGNDEGSIIPRNAVEVHFSNAPASSGDLMSVRNVHIFRNHADTVYTPDPAPRVPYRPGKMNHYEFLISEGGIEVSITPYSEDGVTFTGDPFVYRVDAPLSFSRGYVHVSVHNHATIKYTQPGDAYPSVVDASVARIDNVGFDGPVLSRWREYEVPDSLVQFTGGGFADPHNAEDVGYDIGYVLNDAAEGPRQVLRFEGVDIQNVASARLVFAAWVDGSRQELPPDGFAFRARLNGRAWLERTLSEEEVAFFGDGPTVVDPGGVPVGDPASQGRLGLMIDVPPGDLVAGDNTIELVTHGVPTSYPPLVCNVDLVLATE